MRIAVYNKNKIEEYGMTPHSEKSAVISIRSCKTNSAFIVKNNISNIVDILFLEFNDTDIEDNYGGCITKHDAEKIADFVYKYKDSIDLLIVQCEAGVSRSAGVAAAISKHLFNDDNWAFEKHRPNMLCYRKVLDNLYYKEH